MEMHYILFSLNEILPAAVILIPFYAVLCKVCIHDVRRTILCWIFSAYLCAVYALAGLPNVTYIRFDVSCNLIPFRDMLNGLRSTLQNILLFVPLGIFLPLLWNRYTSIRNTLLFGLGMSLAIELLQIFTYRATDVNDLMTNTLGTLLGFCLAIIPVKKLAGFRNESSNRKKEIWLTVSASFGVMFFLQPVVLLL